MSNEVNNLKAIVRTEFGKGAARRARRDGQVPAVLYGHGTDPRCRTERQNLERFHA